MTRYHTVLLQVQSLFRIFDADGSGHVDKAEFELALMNAMQHQVRVKIVLSVDHSTITIILSVYVCVCDVLSLKWMVAAINEHGREYVAANTQMRESVLVL